MNDIDIDISHSATWPAISSSGYATAEGEMTHAVTYTSGDRPDTPSKVVVRRTFIECVTEETESMRVAANRHRSEPVVPSFAGHESTHSDNDDKRLAREEARHHKASMSTEKSDSEDSVEVFDGGVDCLGDESPVHREASLVGPLPGDSDPKLVVKRTFLEVVDPHLGPDRDQRSQSMPVGGQISEDPNAPSLTDQLLERMRAMQGRSGNSPMKSALSDPAEKEKHSSALSSTAPISPKAEGVRRVSFETVEQAPSIRACLEIHSTPSTGAESETLEPECAPDDVEPDPSLGPRTTVMLRNLPSNYTRPLLLDLLDREGFYSSYDFVYLPIDFGSRSGFGYAFINLADVDTAERFRAHFQGFTGWQPPCDKVADVTWSGTHQGYEQHVNRYRNSPVMHETMPDECKPIVLKDGVRADFPPPTKILRPPRIRPSKNRGAKLAADRH